ncbi:unnamed protein product [Clavelina lepadiformis]|uniref:Uncharacterized protein n=1 Tax=Clavelina lepadiformis TaxID=159417 RepID=A0ABP0FXB8_CLALP
MSQSPTRSIKCDPTNGEVKREKFELKKNFGFWSGVATVVGGLVGSGIFVSPVGVLKSVNGSIGVCLLVWVGSGLIAMMSALCYCELGASLRTSGGEVTSFHAAYGPALSFMFVWSRVLINPGNAATLQVFASYLLSPLYSDGCAPPDSAIKLIAILLLCFLIYLNCVSVKKTVNFEIAFSIIKLLAMALIATGGIVWLALGNDIGKNNFQNGFEPGPLAALTAWDVGMAIYQGNFAYSGYRFLFIICEEIKNVKKNLPRATITALFLVMMMYILVNVGYLSVLTVDEIISSKAVAVTFGKKVLGPMAFLIPLIVCLSTMGNQNGILLVTARLSFAAGRSGLMPRILSMIHVKYFSPIPALLLDFLLVSFFILLGDAKTLIDAFSFFEWTVTGLNAASVLILRRKFPYLDRPYRVPTVIPILLVCLSIYFVVLPFLRRPSFVFVFAVIFYILTLIGYYLYVVKKLRLPGSRRATIFLQKLLQCAETDWDGNEFEKEEKQL